MPTPNPEVGAVLLLPRWRCDVTACGVMDTELDLTSWSVIGPEPGGRDEHKMWLAPDPRSERHEHWLWKPLRTTDDGSVTAISDVAEVAASRLAKLVGLPAAECRFAILGDEVGVASKNVTPFGFDLHDGGTYLHEVPGYVHHSPTRDSHGQPKGHARSDEGYTLDAVEQVLDGVDGPPNGKSSMNAMQVFAGYLALDAVIANTDRHPKNWALLERQSDGSRFLAPTFDHGSALGAGMSDAKRARRDPESFCRKGRASAFSPPGQSLVDLAHEALSRAQATVWQERFAKLSDTDLSGCIDAAPTRLSGVASKFISQVLIINQRRLCDADSAEDQTAPR